MHRTCTVIKTSLVSTLHPLLKILCIQSVSVTDVLQLLKFHWISSYILAFSPSICILRLLNKGLHFHQETRECVSPITIPYHTTNMDTGVCTHAQTHTHFKYQPEENSCIGKISTHATEIPIFLVTINSLYEVRGLAYTFLHSITLPLSKFVITIHKFFYSTSQ